MTIKASTVLVDRLEHALDRQGVTMKRRALLETAAYAFAYASSNAFTAAAEKGDVNPPPVTPIGRMELPDGQVLIVVNDPLANSAYGIDEDFVEQVVDGERRERIGITPYGHLVRLDELSSLEIPDLATSGEREDLSSVTGIIHGAKNHIDGYTATDREADAVGQAELALGRAFEAADFGNRLTTILELRSADALLASIRNDDAELHVLWTRQSIAEALQAIDAVRKPRKPNGQPDDSILKPILMTALREIDQEIENRRSGGDPAAWAEMQKVSDLGHAAARDVALVAPFDDDAESIRISRDDLRLLLRAASSYSEDVNTGLDDGIYEESENQDIHAIDQAIENVGIRLAMDVPAKPSRAAAPKAGSITVHVARIVHSHGSDIRVALDQSALDAQVAEYCRETWTEVSDHKGVPSDPAGMTDREVVSTYYRAMDESEAEDFLDEATFELPLTPSSEAFSGRAECARCGSSLDAKGLCSDVDTCPFSTKRQDDARGWAGHPERDPNAKDDGVPVPTNAPKGSYLGTRPADWADQIAQALEDGAVADVWYDAHEHGSDDPEDPDRIAESTINETQSAMLEAAKILRELKPTVLPDGGIVIDGRLQSRTAIAERARRDARDDLRYITYHNGEDGDVTLTMVAALGLPYLNERGDGIPITDAEFPWLCVGEVLNEDRELTASLGASALWHGRKWLVSEISFPFPDQGDDSSDDGVALRRARRHMEEIAPYVERMGGLMELDEDATEFGHELAILVPFEFAMESASVDDWRKALAYVLSTEAEKKAGRQVSAEYTAQQDIGRGVYSVEPSGDTVWDATVDALRWGRQHAVDIVEGDCSYPDDYAHSAMAPEWVRQRSLVHPFEVQTIGLAAFHGIEGSND